MNGGNSQDINLANEPASPQVADRVLFEWVAPSFSKSERSAKWYAVAGVLILAIIGYSAWQQDWFVISIVIVVSAILFWYLHAFAPQDVTYQLTPMGVFVEGKFNPFSEMHSFWMVYNENVKNLYLVFRKKYLPALVINIEKVDPLILKGYLLKKLPEQEDKGENLIDQLIRMVGL